jgi:hypothetical protein
MTNNFDTLALSSDNDSTPMPPQPHNENRDRQSATSVKRLLKPEGALAAPSYGKNHETCPSVEGAQKCVNS